MQPGPQVTNVSLAPYTHITRNSQVYFREQVLTPEAAAVANRTPGDWSTDIMYSENYGVGSDNPTECAPRFFFPRSHQRRRRCAPNAQHRPPRQRPRGDASQLT